VEQSISDSISGFQIIKSPLQEYFANSFPTYYPGDTIDAFVAAGKGNLQIGQTPTPLVDRQTGKPSSSNTDSVRQIAKVLLVTLLGLHAKIQSASKFDFVGTNVD
jgi:hypothetical protein